MLRTSRKLIICLLTVTILFSFCFSQLCFASGTIFCPECGNQIDAESKYCMFCGCQLEKYITVQKEYNYQASEQFEIPEYSVNGTVLTISGAETVKPKSFIIDWENEKKKITKVIIEDGAVEIRDSAFYGCENLEEVDLPDSLQTIGRSAFSNCKYLRNISIPTRVHTIADSAFSFCDNLKSIDLPDGLISLGDSVFFLCKKLRTLSLPYFTTSIGSSAFRSSGIEKINLPDKIESVGDGVFAGCFDLENVDISNLHPYLEIKNGALFSKPDRRLINMVSPISGEYYIPDGTLCIGNFAFDSCERVSKIVIPAGVTNIGSYAFNSCGKLSEIIIPDSVSTIGNNAFSGCSSDLVLFVSKDTYAEKYCDENQLTYQYIVDTKYEDVEISRINIYDNDSSIDGCLCIRENEPLVLTAEAISKETKSPVPATKILWECSDDSLRITTADSGHQCSLDAVKANTNGLKLKICCNGYEKEYMVYTFEDLTNIHTGMVEVNWVYFDPDLDIAIREYLGTNPGLVPQLSDVQKIKSLRILQDKILINDKYYGTSVNDVVKSAYPGLNSTYGEKWQEFDLSDLVPLSNLEYFEIAGRTLVNTAAFTKCNNLRRLDIAFCSGVDIDAITRCESLTELNINCCHGIIVKNVSNLCKIEGIQFTGNDYDFSYNFDALSGLKNLQYLGFTIGFRNNSSIKSYHTNLGFLQNFTQLKSLVVGDGAFIQDISGIGYLTQLEKLQIPMLSSIVFINNNVPPDYNVLSNLKSLKELDLSGSAGLKSLSFAKGLNNLTFLNIGDTDITDISPLYGKPLQTLTIPGYLYNTAQNMFPDAIINIA